MAWVALKEALQKALALMVKGDIQMALVLKEKEEFLMALARMEEVQKVGLQRALVPKKGCKREKDPMALVFQMDGVHLEQGTQLHLAFEFLMGQV